MTVRQAIFCAALAAIILGIALQFSRHRIASMAGLFLVGLGSGSLVTSGLIPLSPSEMYGVE